LLSTAGSNNYVAGCRFGLGGSKASRPNRAAANWRFQTDVMLRAASRNALRLVAPSEFRFHRSRGADPLNAAEQAVMTFGWIVLGIVGWVLGLVVVLTLFRMAGDQDRAARHEQKRLDPYSDVTITHSGDTN
jgi:hypothetical protein